MFRIRSFAVYSLNESSMRILGCKTNHHYNCFKRHLIPYQEGFYILITLRKINLSLVRILP